MVVKQGNSRVRVNQTRLGPIEMNRRLALVQAHIGWLCQLDLFEIDCVLRALFVVGSGRGNVQICSCYCALEAICGYTLIIAFILFDYALKSNASIVKR